MLYNPPTGSSDANAAYVGKNLASGQQGSKVPPMALEADQREIVNAIVASGQNPTNADLTQLLKAIRSGVLSYFVDVGSANAVSITPTTPVTTMVSGQTFDVKIKATNTGDATFSASGGPAIPIRRGDLSALRPADLVKDTIRRLTRDEAANVMVVSGLISSLTPTSKTVSFLAGGSFSWTVPDGITRVDVEVVGAGGGGAGGGGGSTWSAGGGGSGGTARKKAIVVTPGQAIAIVVGVGGTSGGYTNGSVGGTGGDSSFGPYCSASGATGGNGGTTTGGGGAPGQGLGGDVNLPGAAGGDGNPGNAQVQGGQGGASSMGGGGRTSTVSSSAIDGQAAGSGGGGAWGSGGAYVIGGHGANGAVIITY